MADLIDPDHGRGVHMAPVCPGSCLVPLPDNHHTGAVKQADQGTWQGFIGPDSIEALLLQYLLNFGLRKDGK